MDKTHQAFEDTPYEYCQCTRCGKHIDNLEPFGDEAGEFAGYKLIKNYRWLHFVDYNEECERIMEDISVFGLCQELYDFHGEDLIKRALSYNDRRDWSEKSFECKDCIHEEGDFKHY